jgi:hypothetical protein
MFLLAGKVVQEPGKRGHAKLNVMGTQNPAM